VVKLTMLIAEAVNQQDQGPFKDVRFSEDELEELRLAAWMHDVGKIVTPEYVVDKATKLSTIFDRVELVKSRFALIEKTVQAELLERLLEAAAKGAGVEEMRGFSQEFEDRRQELRRDCEFIVSCNLPGEFMTDDKLARIKDIAAKTYVLDGEQRSYLTRDEVDNLCIRKGTLTAKERKTIENHAVVTLDMLSRLPFPKRLRRVPEFAGSHHEKLDGSGYPNGLTKEDLPLQARILAVADVFEALTAKDRPYKQPMKLSQAVKILGFMKKDGHIDPDVFDLFVNCGLCRQYADKELSPEQIDQAADRPDQGPG
jgi:response regulator RpfG family c-di-GMP phosphodiesterase